MEKATVFNRLTNFAGLAKLKEELASEEWLYNKTPRFTITRPVTLPECIAHNTTVSVTVQVSYKLVSFNPMLPGMACA